MEISSAVENDARMSRYRYLIAIIMMITVGVSYADRVNISILIANNDFLTAMGIESSGVQKGLLMSFFLVAYACANFVLSPLADIYGPRKVICAAIVLWIVSMFLGGVANMFAIMLLSRVILGLGEGMQYPITAVVVRNWFPKHEYGRANALWGVGSTLAPAMAIPMFAWLIQDYGWHSAFWVCVVLNVIALYLVWTFVTDKPKDCPHVNSLELAYIEAEKTASAEKSGPVTREPLMKQLGSFMGDYRYWLLVTWYIGVMLIIWGLMTWLPSYLKDGRGFSWSAMGWLSSLPFVLGIGVKIFTGWAVDYTRKSGIFCALSTMGGGIAIYFSATIDNNWTSAILICLAQGCMYMGAPASWTLLQGIVPEKSMSTAGGVMIGIATIAGAASPTIIGYFVSLSGDYTGALFFLIFAAIFSSAAMIPLAKR